MRKTKSHIQVVDVSNSTIASQLVIRPPKFMQVFRCSIYYTSSFEGNLGYLATQQMSSDLDGMQFTNVDSGNIAASILPSKWPTNNAVGIKQLILDRRGIGYFCDEFHVFSSSGDLAYFYFVWEGQMED